ncbi:hypothetical protein BT69DRAFT_1329860 [Atractiella rhizophila]|nr:hypothetical protein BT69DRAFT_1329860 [Atractiella rhizophila]
MSYFVGTPNGEDNGHDNDAAKIAAAGKEWARDYWRREDMAAYMFLLVLEYGRILSRDENNSFDFVDDLDFIKVRRT